MTWPTRHAKVLLAVYSAVLAAALLSPSSHEQSGLVWWLVAGLRHLGIPGTVATFARMEVLMNVLIIAPVTLLGSLWQPGLSWRDWTGYGFVAAMTVEIAQGLLLPGREASFSDVVANTAGALLGALLGAVLVSVRRPTLRARR